VSAGWTLSPGAARVFYNAADAWVDRCEELDAVAALAPLAPQLAAPRARLRLERALWLLEWSPRLGLRSTRGLSWLPREERRAWLDRLEQSGLWPTRRAAERVHALVDACYAEPRRRSAASAPSAAS